MNSRINLRLIKLNIKTSLIVQVLSEVSLVLYLIILKVYDNIHSNNFINFIPSTFTLFLSTLPSHGK